MAKKPKADTPIADLCERLMSTQMSTVDIVASLRDFEASIAKSRASTPEDRQRWAEQKKRQRGAGGQMSTVDNSAAISVSGTNPIDGDSGKTNSAQNVHGGHSRSKGGRIPDDWGPTDDDVAYGIEHCKLLPGEVAGCAEDMRLWAQANANRAVARKANWSLTLKGWMRRAAPDIIRKRPRGGGPNGQAPNAQPAGFAGLAARIRAGDTSDQLPPGQPPRDR